MTAPSLQENVAALDVQPDMLQAALDLAAQGFAVFPIRAGDKTPLTEHGFHDASKDPEQARIWWTQWPNANLGVATGAASGCIVVDVDGDVGLATLATLQEGVWRNDLPLTKRSWTGKGEHRFYRLPAGCECVKSSAVDGVDIRCDGGYVVAPPSLHPNGRRYDWDAHAPAEMALAPDWLVEWARGRVAKRNKPRSSAEVISLRGIAARALKGLEAGGELPEADLDMALDADGEKARARVAALTDRRLRTVCAFLLDANVFARKPAVSKGVSREQWLALPRMLMKLRVPEETIWSIWSTIYAGDDHEMDTREAVKWVSSAEGYGLPEFMKIVGVAAQQEGRDDVLSALNGLRREAREGEKGGVTLDDFHAYMPQHAYIFAPTGETWPAASVNARIAPIALLDRNEEPLLDDKGKPKRQSASDWLDKNRAVEQMTWAPGEPKVIADKLVENGGWVERTGVNCFNQYRPPALQIGGDANEAGPWLEHLRRIYPQDAEHILDYFAHRTQRPQEKINHALVLGGPQGIGKDTLLEPIKRAVGPWNFAEVSPQQMLGRFNAFLKSVILRLSEARDLGEVNRYQFYEHMKAYTASPPDVLRVDEKNLREHAVLNCCAVVITTNHKTDGIYLPFDDRRHYVAWSDCVKEEFGPEYWNHLWAWYETGGYAHVAAYLRERDICGFDPKAPPPKTQAFWDIANASRAPEESEIADVIDALGGPDALTLEQLANAAGGRYPETHGWLTDRKNRRIVPHRLEDCGYVPVRNQDDKRDGLWKIEGRRVTIYAKKERSDSDRLVAARDLVAKAQQGRRR